MCIRFMQQPPPVSGGGPGGRPAGDSPHGTGIRAGAVSRGGHPFAFGAFGAGHPPPKARAACTVLGGRARRSERARRPRRICPRWTGLTVTAPRPCKLWAGGRHLMVLTRAGLARSGRGWGAAGGVRAGGRGTLAKRRSRGTMGSLRNAKTASVKGAAPPRSSASTSGLSRQNTLPARRRSARAAGEQARKSSRQGARSGAHEGAAHRSIFLVT